ncbi:MAG: M23 family metallopeptidase [bacterium]|nr:M23 family metallopeptidase [bacterium]MCP5068288.1 M23 family metallopeptidase [bacterium]
MTGRAWGVIAMLALAIVTGTSIWLRCEGVPPEIRAPDQIVIGRAGLEINVGAKDPRSGIKELEVRLRHAGGDAAVFHQSYPGSLPTGAITKPGVPDVVAKLDPKALGLTEGEAFLIIEATDWSWAALFSGNTSVLEVPVRIDLKAPRVSVDTGLTYVKRAGSASVVYRVTEEAPRDGVLVGEAFFKGHPLPGDTDGRRIAIFAIPRDAPANVPIRVVAEDAAGNRGTGSWATRLQERGFNEDTIPLGQGFLTGKVPELADALGLDASDPVAVFQHINREVRAANEAEIRRIVARGTSELAFEGRFLQMRGSKVTSRFAEHRSYIVDGKKVSEAIHYGYDLASTAGAGIEAANAGRVLFADALGIYGNCVILDHGLGVTSLYGHLSRIDVGPGDQVTRGQTLGTSGATGLAGGDHLHFAILVGDTYVDPKEWWDAKWVREHIEARLEPRP